MHKPWELCSPRPRISNSRAVDIYLYRVMRMQFVKIHTAGSDYVVCDAAAVRDARVCARLLDRHTGVGGEGLLLVGAPTDADTPVRLILPDGSEGEGCVTAAQTAARALFARGKCRTQVRIALDGTVYPVRLSRLGARVLCVFAELPPLVPRPMDGLKYHYGIRGEVLRACLARPRLSICDLGGTHAVFLLESAAALRALDVTGVCRRLAEVLFYGERIHMHFVAVSGDNALSMRCWQPARGELAAGGEGAATAVYTARAAGLCDSDNVPVRARGGSFCVELCGKAASVCAKSEVVFTGKVG